MNEILLATGNPGKVRELVPLFEPASLKLVSLADLGLANDHEETGNTFHENSGSKALYYSRKTNIPVIADDSGLVIDALNGLPGVRSARYPNADMPYPERCRHILEQLKGYPEPDKRTARFCCIASLAVQGKLLHQSEGTVEGWIAHEARGTRGFGYDPIFFYEPLHRTFAELRLEEKNRLSHRFHAFRSLLEVIPELLP